MKTAEISFRELAVEDLPLLHKWLNEYQVREWYQKTPINFEQVVQKYSPRITGKEPTKPFLMVLNNKPVGYIQTYLIKDYPEYDKKVEIKNSASVDLFIGETDSIHKGFGQRFMVQFLNDYVFSSNEVEFCVVGPDPKNQSAIKTYEKVGFKYFKIIEGNENQELEYLMTATRRDITNP